MDSQKTHTASIKKVYDTTLKYLKNQPSLFVPFIIFFLFDLIALSLLYLAPRMPLRLIFGPPIRTFWGERFLHYPLNFLLLPKLISLARMALSVIFGSLFTGMAVAIVSHIYNKKQIKLSIAFQSALKKYFSLFFIVFIFTFLYFILVRIITIGLWRYFIAGHSRLLFLEPYLWTGPILIGINFLLALLVQSAFIYAIPILLIEKEKFRKAIIKSFGLFKKLCLPTLILVSLPTLAYIPVIILNYNTVFLINKLFPEIILWVLFLGSIISALVIDPLITISTTFLYLANREDK